VSAKHTRVHLDGVDKAATPGLRAEELGKLVGRGPERRRRRLKGVRGPGVRWRRGKVGGRGSLQV
jgi:hypothetical protein